MVTVNMVIRMFLFLDIVLFSGYKQEIKASSYEGLNLQTVRVYKEA